MKGQKIINPVLLTPYNITTSPRDGTSYHIENHTPYLLHITDSRVATASDIILNEIFTVRPFNSVDIKYIDSEYLMLCIDDTLQSALNNGAETYLLVTTIAPNESAVEQQGSGNLANYNMSAIDEDLIANPVSVTVAPTQLGPFDLSLFNGFYLYVYSPPYFVTATIFGGDTATGGFTQEIQVIASYDRIAIPKIRNFVKIEFSAWGVDGPLGTNVDIIATVRRTQEEILQVSRFQYAGWSTAKVVAAAATPTLYMPQFTNTHQLFYSSGGVGALEGVVSDAGFVPMRDGIRIDQSRALQRVYKYANDRVGAFTPTADANQRVISLVSTAL